MRRYPCFWVIMNKDSIGSWLRFVDVYIFGSESVGVIDIQTRVGTFALLLFRKPDGLLVRVEAISNAAAKVTTGGRVREVEVLVVAYIIPSELNMEKAFGVGPKGHSGLLSHAAADPVLILNR